jgi:hypothetical protein
MTAPGPDRVPVPEDIADSIEAVLGLDNRAQARPYAGVNGTPEAVANISYIHARLLNYTTFRSI